MTKRGNKQEVLSRYLDSQGVVKSYPRRLSDKHVVLTYMVESFDQNRTYTEKEVNDLLNMLHSFGDWAVLRRDMYDAGLLDRSRDGSLYWRRDGKVPEQAP